MSDTFEEEVKPELIEEPDPNELAGQLWSLMTQFENEDDEAWRAIFNDAVIGEFYWTNRQHIYSRTNDQGILVPEEDDQSDLYTANEYRPNGESIIAAMAVAPPKLNFYPDDADNADDITTAQAYQKIAQLIEKHNEASSLLTRILYILYNESYVAVYNYTDEKSKYGTYEIDEYKDVEQVVQKKICPNCASELNDTISPYNCQVCKAQFDKPEIIEEIQVFPKLVGKTKHPKTRVNLKAFGPLHVRIAPYVQSLEDSPYLTLKFEAHPSKARHEFKEFKQSLTRGGMTTSTTYEREYRAEIYRGEHSHLDTWTCLWLRSSVYDLLDEDDKLYKYLVSNYPNGIAAIFVNKTLVDLRDENLDDHWTLNNNPLSTFVAGEPLGKAGIPLQDVTNEVLNLSVDTIQHGIPQTFATTDALDLNKYKASEIAPGKVWPVKSLPPGQSLSNMIMTTRTATLSQEVQGVRDSVRQQSQLATGAFPSIYGGVVQGSRTASEYAQSRAQALQRLSITWNMVKTLWSNVMSKACPQFANNLKYDEKFVEKHGASFINIWIKKTELTGKIGQVEPDIDEQLPTSWAQQRDVLIRLIEMNNPLVNEVISDPNNSVIVKGALGFKELTVPGFSDRVKQLDEIQKIISSPPDAELNLIDPVLDNHEIEASTCRAFLISTTGLALREINPQAYERIKQHFMQHMQIMSGNSDQPGAQNG